MGKSRRLISVLLILAMAVSIPLAFSGVWADAEVQKTILTIDDYTVNPGQTFTVELKYTQGYLSGLETAINLTEALQLVSYTKQAGTEPVDNIVSDYDNDEHFMLEQRDNMLVFGWEFADFFETLSPNQTIISFDLKLKAETPVGTKISLFTSKFSHRIYDKYTQSYMSNNGVFEFGSVYAGISKNIVDGFDSQLIEAFKNSFKSQYINAQLYGDLEVAQITPSDISSSVSGTNKTSENIEIDGKINAKFDSDDTYGAATLKITSQNSQDDLSLYWNNTLIYAITNIASDKIEVCSTIDSLTNGLDVFATAFDIDKDDYKAWAKALINLYGNSKLGLGSSLGIVELIMPLILQIYEKFGFDENTTLIDIINSEIFIKELYTIGNSSNYVITLNTKYVVDVVKQVLHDMNLDQILGNLDDIIDLYDNINICLQIGVLDEKVTSLSLDAGLYSVYNSGDAMCLNLTLDATIEYESIQSIDYPEIMDNVQFTDAEELTNKMLTISDNSEWSNNQLIGELLSFDTLKLVNFGLNNKEYSLLVGVVDQRINDILYSYYSEHYYRDFVDAAGKTVMALMVSDDSSIEIILMKINDGQLTEVISTGVYDQYYEPKEFVKLLDGNYEYARYSQDSNEYFEIPSTYNGKSVVSIGNWSFALSGIKNVVIPSSIQYIDYAAFYGCYNLESVVFEQTDNLKRIENSAFFRTGLSTITIPASVEYIGSYTFSENSNLKTVNFEEGSKLKRVEIRAFSMCTSLDLVLPYGVRYLGTYAAANINSINVPSTVKTTAAYCFEQIKTVCLNWENVSDIPKGLNYAFSEIGYNVTAIVPAGMVNTYRNILTFVDNVYSADSFIDDIYVMDGDILIGYMGDVRDIILPEYVKYIDMDNNLFKNHLFALAEIRSVTVKGEVPTFIDGGYPSEQLNDMMLQLFEGVLIVPDGTRQQYMSRFEQNPDIFVYYFQDKAIFKIYEQSEVVDGFVYALAVDEYFNFSTTDILLHYIDDGKAYIDIPENTKAIFQFAFYHTSLETINIADSVEFIGSSAFCYSTELTQLNIGVNSKLKTIEDKAFYHTGLTNLFIPSAIEFIGECEQFSQMHITMAENAYYTMHQGVIYNNTLKEIVFITADIPSILEILDGVTGINGATFYGETNITKVIIPKSVVRIMDQAFRGCYNLNEVIFAEDSQLEVIGNYAFAETALSQIILPQSLKEIGTRAFDNLQSYYTSIHISKNVETIHNQALKGIKHVTIDQENPYFKMYEGILYTADYKTMVMSTEDISSFLILPDGLVEIHAYAFADKLLEYVYIPSTVQIISDYAFYNCYWLQTIEFGQSSQLQLIGDYAFYETKISSIMIPAGVTYYGYYCFNVSWGYRINIYFENDNPADESITVNEIGSWERILIHCQKDSLVYQMASYYGYNTVTPTFASLSFDTHLAGYGGYTIKMTNDSNTVEIIINESNNFYNLGSVMLGVEYIVTVTALDGSVIYSENVVFSQEYLHVSIALNELRDYRLTVLDDFGNKITTGFEIKWYIDGVYYKSGGLITAIDFNYNVKYEVVLFQAFGIKYVQDEKKDATGEDYYSLKLLPKHNISGNVKDAYLQNMQGVSVSVTQLINGRFTHELLPVVTDSDGNYNITVTEGKAILTFYKANFKVLTQEIEYVDGDCNVDVSLNAQIGRRLEVTIYYNEAVLSNKKPTDKLVASFSDYTFVVSNLTKGSNIVISAQYPYLVISDDSIVEDNDILEITATDKFGRMFADTVMITLNSDLTAKASIKFVENGYALVNIQRQNSIAKTVMVFDSNGVLVEAINAATHTLEVNTARLNEGKYKIVVIDYLASLTSVPMYSDFAALGLKKDVDFFEQDILINLGIITNVKNAKVPSLDVDKIAYADFTMVRLMHNEAVAGVSVMAHVEYSLKSAYKNSSDKQLVITMPENMMILAGSATINGIKSNFTKQGQDYIFETQADVGKLLFYIAATKEGNYSLAARLNFTAGSLPLTQFIGSDSLAVSALTLNVPSKVGRASNIVVSGLAMPNSIVRIYDDDVLVAETSSNSLGNFSVSVELNDITAGVTSSHVIYAKITTSAEAGSITVQSQSKTLLYDANLAQLSSIIIHNYTTTIIDFTTAQTKLISYTYVPSHREFTFVANFGLNNDDVSDVFIVVKTVSNQTVYLKAYRHITGYVAKGEFDTSDVPKWVGCSYVTEGVEGSEGRTVVAIIDPSGYVYEAVNNNRIEGVKATILYVENLGDTPIVWVAEDYNQSNPLYTDEDGLYAWDVPQGYWKVIFEKEGFYDAETDWLPVPPPQVDINIAMTRIVSNPEVENIAVYENFIDISFNYYVDAKSLDCIQINWVTVPIEDIELLDFENGYVRSIRINLTQSLIGNVHINVIDVKSYNGQGMINNYSDMHYVKATPASIIVYDDECQIGNNITMSSDDDSLVINVDVLNADQSIIDDAALTYSVSNNYIVEVVRNGRQFTITPRLFGNVKITFKTENGLEYVLTIQVTMAIAAADISLVSADVQSGKLAEFSLIGLYSLDADADIYYTINGDDPTVNGILYDSNYIIAPEQGVTFTIKAVASIKGIFGQISTFEYQIIPDVRDIIAIGGTFEYDGQTKNITISNLPVGVTYTAYHGENQFNGATQKGNYNIFVELIYNEEVIDTLDIMLIITAPDVSSVTISGATVEYDGEIKNIAVSELPIGVSCKAYLNQAEFNGTAEAGEHYITVELIFDGEVIRTEYVWLIINMPPPEIPSLDNVTVSGGTFVYDGNVKDITITGIPAGVTYKAYVDDDEFLGTSKKGIYEIVVIFFFDDQEIGNIETILTINARYTEAQLIEEIEQINTSGLATYEQIATLYNILSQSDCQDYDEAKELLQQKIDEYNAVLDTINAELVKGKAVSNSMFGNLLAVVAAMSTLSLGGIGVGILALKRKKREV